MDMGTTVVLEDECGTTCHVLLFTKVENAVELRQMIMKGQVEASLIKPQMVVGAFPVLVATNKAVRSCAASKMVTHTIHSEILFNLSPSKNITESLKTFGLGDSDEAVVAVVLERKAEGEAEAGDGVQKLQSQIKGQLTELSELSSLMDEGQVRALYKISDAELSIGTLEDAVVARVACKECLAL